MKIKDFISENKEELTRCINRVLKNDENQKISNEEIRLWILNDEGLYNWARNEGCKI